MKSILWFFLLFLVGGSCAAAERGDPLTILFAGSANGILNSCHCPSNPWGGLAKRAWLIHMLRTAAGTDRVITLDTGDLFSVDQDVERSSLLLKLCTLMDYQAVAVGDQELAGGLESWVRINQLAGLWDTSTRGSTFPWLSGGYRLKSGIRKNQFLTPAWTVFERCGLRIGIVSVSHSKIWRLQKSKPKGVKLASPSDTLDTFLKATRGKLDLTIVISHQGIDEDRLLAAQAKDIDLIIGGHSQSLISPPEVVNGVAICQAGKNGENLGVLLLKPCSETLSCGISVNPQKGLGQNGAADAFRPTSVQTPRWHMSQQLIPLNDAVDDDGKAATLIGTYLKEQDKQNAMRLAVPDPHAVTNTPQLVLSLPTTPINLTVGERRNVSFRMGNRGSVTLKVERVRSKSPWMRVLDAPQQIDPFSEAVATFELVTDKMDRFFRCDFSVTANDPLRPVVQGVFTGQVEGDRRGLLDVPSLWSNLCERVRESAMAPTRPAMVPLLSDLTQAVPPTTTAGQQQIRVEFFFAPGCSDCQIIEDDILPGLSERFEGFLDLQKLDVTVASNYVHFARLSNRLRISPTNTIAVFVDETIPLLGLDAIRKSLERVIEERINNQ
jgi:hypothetical protein